VAVQEVMNRQREKDKTSQHFFHNKTSDSSSPTESIFSLEGYLSPLTPNIFCLVKTGVKAASFGLPA
jgi:hypothetical protein